MYDECLYEGLALTEFRDTRRELVKQLEQIRYLWVIPTQENYVMCEVIGQSAREVCIRLFEEGNLLKDLTAKVANGHEYIRVAIRTREDNARLIEGLKYSFKRMDNGVMM